MFKIIAHSIAALILIIGWPFLITAFVASGVWAFLICVYRCHIYNELWSFDDRWTEERIATTYNLLTKPLRIGRWLVMKAESHAK